MSFRLKNCALVDIFRNQERHPTAICIGLTPVIFQTVFVTTVREQFIYQTIKFASHSTCISRICSPRTRPEGIDAIRSKTTNCHMLFLKLHAAQWYLESEPRIVPFPGLTTHQNFQLNSPG